ncbi:DUF4421 family protein [Winogradskyella sp. PAMC22761]|nr:DUF4421 family protein [Winogradskyella sp. PAMC22761]
MLCFTGLTLSAQDIEDLDSLLVDRDIDNYSIRLFTNFKVNKFSIRDGDSKAKFVPNNRYGLGLGFANEKIIIDLAVNIKNPNKNKTSRFDLQGTTIVKDRNYVKLFTQIYKGFNAKNNFNEPKVFRDDIRSVSIGVNYLHTFDDIEFSYSLLKAGLSEKNNKNIFITGGVGVFGSFDYFSSGSGLLSETTSPYFNDEGNVKRYQGLSFGAMGGLISYFKLPYDITATVNFMPGIGFAAKKVTIEDDRYHPSSPMLYKIDFLIGLNYNFNQFYVSLTYNNDLNSTSLDYGNNYLLNLTKAKLAVGYKLGRRR